MPRFVLVTGCSSGIGLAAAQALGQHGFTVIASARKAEDVERLLQQGLLAVQLDLADPASIELGASAALHLADGRLYGLFNNGAYGQPGALEDLPTEALREQFNTNLFGWHHLIRQVLPAMLEAREGRIVQNSSVLGLVAMKYRGAYNASKFALEGYSDTLRLELAGSGVHISLIEPGPIDTRFRANARASFLRHIDPTKSRHQAAYQQTLNRLEREGGARGFTLPSEACLPPLIHALTSARPKARYPVTTPTRVFALLRRILPTRWLDKLLAKSA
ncbi:SDR family oxidoreductase [Aeromonas jandaei]|uniref:SDR family oxidoreductase n=1 Tax=Aeromonas jandaei TaxID=650 RepID=UPI001EEED154|nr:SDR family oxidoreductase [Aeromonas jandaei]MCF7719698.1 SDR family oxidoreductase [Aeromonas jandaei]